MDETGLWRLFLSTGLPEAYLMARHLGEKKAFPPVGKAQAQAADLPLDCGAKQI